MKFRNAKVPEGINVSRHSPLADLLILSIGVFAGFGLLALAAVYFGGALARYTPMSWENRLASAFFEPALEGLELEEGTVGQELQELADRLAARMTLPEGLEVTVHYVDDEKVNAFATLGGHLFVLRGLIERMPNENALAMVMAHEIAHAANRDVASALGGSVLLQLVFSAVVGSAPGSFENILAGESTILLLAFTRDAERQADEDALAAVAAHYGHVEGAATLFEIILEQSRDHEPPELLSSHPLTPDRIAAIEGLAEARGWAAEGALTPLSPGLDALGDTIPE
jgi:Zn-dependent protease with chaperone function